MTIFITILASALVSYLAVGAYFGYLAKSFYAVVVWPRVLRAWHNSTPMPQDKRIRTKYGRLIEVGDVLISTSSSSDLFNVTQVDDDGVWGRYGPGWASKPGEYSHLYFKEDTSLDLLYVHLNDVNMEVKPLPDRKHSVRLMEIVRRLMGKS